MKTVFYTGSKTFEIKSTSVTDPGPDEVSVRVAYCGICGTDLHIFHGRMDGRVKPPQIIGHEMSGVVESVGCAVKEWHPGDRVVVRPLDWCGDCPACRAGHSHICMNLKFMGIDSVGAFQELWTVNERTLYRVPDDLSLLHSTLIEPLSVACHDVRMAELKAGEYAVVLGGGPIGLLIAMVARAAGAKILISEINAVRLKFAQDAGFETINPLERNIIETVNKATDDIGADVVFEVTGAEAGAKLMTNLVRTRGRIVIVGIHNQPQPVDLFRFFWRELKLSGARLYESEDFENGLKLAASGSLPFDQLITGIYDLDDIQGCFESLDGDTKAIKTMIKCS